jgi:chromosome segregation ATPase
LGVLLVTTLVTSVEYVRQIRRAHKEYQKAKSLVEDIVLSFNRELRREADRLEQVTFQVEGSSAKADASLKKIDTVERRFAPLEEHLGNLNQNFTQTSTSVVSGLTGLELKIKDIEASQEALRQKIIDVEGQIQKIQEAPPEIKSESPIPVLPIKRDKALAALTDTEIAVLEMLVKEGAKTAPEIKEHVQLSREHTARLMKKLYEEGYLERETGKIPFRYNVKKEMESLLQKAENQPTPATG